MNELGFLAKVRTKDTGNNILYIVTIPIGIARYLKLKKGQEVLMHIDIQLE